MVKRPTPSLGGDDDNGGNDDMNRRRLDPLVRALLGHLPAAHGVWPPQERQKWIGLLSDVFGVIYKDAPDPPKGAAGAGQHPGGPVQPPKSS